MMMNQMNRAELLHWIDVVSFVVTDMTLYLDSHPEDAKAQEVFQKYLGMRKGALKTFAQKYGPLVVDSADMGNTWVWCDMPLPWEGDCR